MEPVLSATASQPVPAAASAPGARQTDIGAFAGVFATASGNAQPARSDSTLSAAPRPSPARHPSEGGGEDGTGAPKSAETTEPPPEAETRPEVALVESPVQRSASESARNQSSWFALRASAALAPQQIRGQAQGPSAAEVIAARPAVSPEGDSKADGPESEGKAAEGAVAADDGALPRNPATGDSRSGARPNARPEAEPKPLPPAVQPGKAALPPTLSPSAPASFGVTDPTRIDAPRESAPAPAASPAPVGGEAPPTGAQLVAQPARSTEGRPSNRMKGDASARPDPGDRFRPSIAKRVADAGPTAPETTEFAAKARNAAADPSALLRSIAEPGDSDPRDRMIGTDPAAGAASTSAPVPGSTASAASPAAAQHAAQQTVAQQIAAAVTKGPGGTTEIALSPEELGKVRLSLSGSEGSMIVTIMAERAETADLMRRHIESLAQEFRALGYGDVSFSFGDDGGRGAESQTTAAAEATETMQQTAETGPEQTTAAPDGTGALDLKL